MTTLFCKIWDPPDGPCFEKLGTPMHWLALFNKLWNHPPDGQILGRPLSHRCLHIYGLGKKATCVFHYVKIKSNIRDFFQLMHLSRKQQLESSFLTQTWQSLTWIRIIDWGFNVIHCTFKVLTWVVVSQEQFGNPNYFSLSWAERSVQVRCRMLPNLCTAYCQQDLSINYVSFRRLVGG